MPFWAIQPSKTAKTGVVHGDDARPKAKPADNGANEAGTFFCQTAGSGPSGKGIFKTPRRFRPMKIAKRATKIDKESDVFPYIFPNKLLKSPRKTNERTIPVQKLRLF